MKVIKLLGVTILLLVVTSVTLSNRSLDDTQVVADLSREIASLEHANCILRSELATRGSLLLAIDKLAPLGYAEPETIAALPEPGHVASR